jgi:hypothetical protein
MLAATCDLSENAICRIQLAATLMNEIAFCELLQRAFIWESRSKCRRNVLPQAHCVCEDLAS